MFKKVLHDEDEEVQVETKAEGKKGVGDEVLVRRDELWWGRRERERENWWCQ